MSPQYSVYNIQSTIQNQLTCQESGACDLLSREKTKETKPNAPDVKEAHRNIKVTIVTTLKDWKGNMLMAGEKIFKTSAETLGL